MRNRLLPWVVTFLLLITAGALQRAFADQPRSETPRLVVGIIEQLGALSIFDQVHGSRALVLFLFLLAVLLLRPQGVFVREKAGV
jgi:hypothetical protein